MSNSLQKDEVLRYFHGGANNCPYCGSDNLDGFGFEETEGEEHADAMQEVECNSCHVKYAEYYCIHKIN